MENCNDNDIDKDESTDEELGNIEYFSNDSFSDSESNSNSLQHKKRRKTVHHYANTSDSNIDSDDYGCSGD